jgi:hypothetical protein
VRLKNGYQSPRSDHCSSGGESSGNLGGVMSEVVIDPHSPLFAVQFESALGSPESTNGV